MMIRPAREGDLPTCAELFRVEELRFVDGEYADAGYLEHFLDERYFLVAEEDGRVAGAAYGEPLRSGGAVLWMVSVHESTRGAGIGKSLVEAFERNCKEAGNEWVFLLALDTEKHERFYKRLGFKSGKRLVEYVKDF